MQEPSNTSSTASRDSQTDVERLLYWESFDDVHKAIAREKQLKGWRRSKKIALIETINPHWLDLAREWFPWMTTSGEGRGVLRLRRTIRFANRSAPLSMTERLSKSKYKC